MQMSFLYAQAESCGGAVAGLCVVVQHRSLNPAPCTRYPIPKGPKGDESYVPPNLKGDCYYEEPNVDDNCMLDPYPWV